MAAVVLAVFAFGHEFIEVVEAFVVPHIGHDVPVVGDDDVGALVFEPAHAGVFARRRIGVLGVDLHDVSKTVRLVGEAFGAGVETWVFLLPTHGGGLVLEPVPLVLGRGPVRAEETVEVLLPRQNGAPWGGPARAVAQCAFDEAAALITPGLHQFRTGHRSGQLEFGVQGDPAVPSPAPDVFPGRPLLLALQFHDAQPHRLTEDIATSALLGGGPRGCGEHDSRVDVLVVAHQNGLLAVLRAEDVGVVVVVAKLLGLCLGALIIEVELRRVAEQGISPADDRGPFEAFGDIEHVDGGVDRFDGVEVQSSVPGRAPGGRR